MEEAVKENATTALGHLSEEETPSKYDAITAAKDDTAGSLTVGFELEVLFPTLRSESAPDPHLFEPGAVYRGNGHEDEISEEHDDAFDEWLVAFLQDALPDERFRVEKDDKFLPPHDNVPLYDAWRVVKDGSVDRIDLAGFRRSPDSCPYTWMGREITSEVLNVDGDCVDNDGDDDSDNSGGGGGGGGQDTYIRKIIAICSGLRQARVHLNDTTAVHVHVGRGEETFSLLTMKKFATLLWLTDGALLALQHPTRRRNEYCAPVTSASNLALMSPKRLAAEGYALDWGGVAQMAEFLPADLLDSHDHGHGHGLLAARLRRIWGAGGVEELADLMMCTEMTISERGSVGFKRFLPAGKTGGNTHTFEWRQMAGCLDPLPIILWAEVCIRFTDFARLSPAAKYKALVADILERGERFTGLDLLRALGLNDEADHYETQLEDYKQGRCELFKGESEGDLFLLPMY